MRRNDWPIIFEEFYEVLRSQLEIYGHKLNITKESMWKLYEAVCAFKSKMLIRSLPMMMHLYKKTLVGYETDGL